MVVATFNRKENSFLQQSFTHVMVVCFDVSAKTLLKLTCYIMESTTINIFPESTDHFSRYRFLCMGDTGGQ